MTVLKVSTTTSYICLLTKARSSRGRSHQAALPESQERERHRLKLISKTEKSRPSANKIVGQNDSMEDTLKNSTVGLVRLEDFQQRRKEIEEAKASQAACMSELKEQIKKVKKCTKAKLTLSFAIDDEEGDFSQEPRRRFSLIVKREEAERKEREQLRQEWLQQQDELKMEDIEITYSYWDGSGHRKSVARKATQSPTSWRYVTSNFQRGISVDNLMYIELKEDLMIPHHYIFYDFIVNKARGNSGLLFNFDVDDDVRLLSDAMMEKDGSHAGKVVERGWYKRLTKRRRPRHLKSPPPMKPRQLPVRETQFQAVGVPVRGHVIVTT
ncbi:XAP5, circadian clock regulator-domain-containing protein [Pisolithus microcarpus]|nr:XAP5, circadian clock regulator-domain-containing protein [Pisolithus microcarpus]